MLLKGTYTVDNIPAYEQYGATPSSNYPSKIETVGSNINRFDRSIFRSGGRVGADAARLYSMQTYKFSKDKQYIISTNLDLTIYNYALNLLSSNVSTSTVFQDTGWKSAQPLQFNYSSSDYYVGLIIKKKDNSAISLEEIADVWFKIEDGSEATPYSYYNQGSVKINVVNSDNTESQTAIMPIQQEMLEGDYVADVEHHEWEKLILTGDEDWHKSSTTEVDRFSYNTSEYPAFADGLSNYFLVRKGIGTNVGTLVFNAGTQIVVNFSDYGTTTLEEFKAWLKSKYDAGNPVTIYYKLATPTNLELTTEQKAIRDTKLNTYKNVTNISLSDELANIDVEYKKDLETIINNALATNVAE